MASPPCDQPIPPLTPPWSGIHTIVRCCWKSRHQQIEIRYITVSGASALGEPLLLENGETVAIPATHVPYGAKAVWAVGVLVNDVTNSSLEGLQVVVEFYNNNRDKGKREVIAASKTVSANTLESLSKSIQAPESHHG